MLISPASVLLALLLLLDAADGASKKGSKSVKLPENGTLGEDGALGDEDAGEEDGGSVGVEAVGTGPGCAERVVIIGGGFAGLAAARDLLLAGHTDVTIVEAMAEVGGRTATVEVSDGEGRTWPGVTQGAHWVLGSDGKYSEPAAGPPRKHGRKHGAAYEYAALADVPDEDFEISYYHENWATLVPGGAGRFPEDVPTYDMRESCPWYGGNGTCCNWEPDPGVCSPRNAVWEEVYGEAQRSWTDVPHKGRAVHKSWDKAFELDAAREFPLNNATEACIINSVEENDFGAPSARWRGGKYKNKGKFAEMWAGNLWEGVGYTASNTFRNGWTPIYKWLEQDIKDLGGVILKNTRVYKVQRLFSSEDPIQLKIKVKEGEPSKAKNQKEILLADRVVSTVSVGVLKQSIRNKGLKFSPALPPKHREAIKNIGMGQLEKIWLFFPTMFWNRTKLYDQEGIDGMYYVGHVPAILEEDTIKFSGIVFGIEDSRIQIWFSGDDAVRYMKDVRRGTPAFEELKTTITDKVMDAMRDMFENDARFRDTDNNTIAPEEPLRNLTEMSNWIADPNFLGCYAYLTRKAGPGVTQWKEDLDKIPASHKAFDRKRAADFQGYSGDRLALGAPATDGPWADRLFFAGEATSLGVPALVHGAIESGRRAAIEVSCQSACSQSSSCAPGGMGMVKAAVPYFKKNSDSHVPKYNHYSEIKKLKDWDTRYKLGYEWLGLQGKKGYQSVGCTKSENEFWFERAEKKVDNFRKALKKLRYVQSDFSDYKEEEEEWIWIGDYNCYINHYNSWDWADFVSEWDTTSPLETLGYSEGLWDSDATEYDDAAYNKDWKGLSPSEKEAAGELCYNEHIWDNWGVGCDGKTFE